MKEKRPQRYSAHAQRPMGLGKLGGANMIFVRKFRFSLEGSNLEDWSIKAVSLNLTKNTLMIRGYEVVETPNLTSDERLRGKAGKDVPIEIWATGLSEGRWPNEVLRLTTFDGCGNGLYEYTFEGLKIIDRQLDFNMDVSDESLQNILVSFKNYKRVFLPESYKHYWRFLLEGNNREIDVVIEGRPNIDIEETSINFMNAKMFLPGKAKWQKLTMHVKQEDVPSLLKLVNSGAVESYTAGKLRLYDGNDELRETWTLNRLWATGFDRLNNNASIRLVFDQVNYESHLEEFEPAKSDQ